MGEPKRFLIGTEVTCSDGPCGAIRRMVMDPVTRSVSHLVVEPKHRQGLGRLVPISLVDDSAGGVRIGCTRAELDALEEAEETEFLPGSGPPRTDYPIGEALPEPSEGLGDLLGTVPQPITFDLIPKGEVEVRRGEEVVATDGAIGVVRGMVVDSTNRHLLRVVLQEGHLWGRREVDIPVELVADMDDGIRLTIAKKDVKALPGHHGADRTGSSR